MKTDGGVVCWGAEARGSAGVDGGQRQVGGDYDADDDGLIEVSNLAQLDAVRHDLDGDGFPANEASSVAYYVAFPDAPADMGCPADGCVGYELVANLDLDANCNVMADAGDAYWNDGAGWIPIGVGTDELGSSKYDPFDALFDGNGYTIANLYINRKGSRHPHGLFGATGAGSRVRNVGLTLVDLAAGSSAGGLVGSNRGIIEKGYVMGVVTGEDRVGGLVGYNRGGIIIDSYASVAVAGTSEFGGLVGSSNGIIAASYAVGDVYGSGPAPPVVAADELPRPNTVHHYSWGGGLVGSNAGVVMGSYTTGKVIGTNAIGGLVGENAGLVTDSYAMGEIGGAKEVGGLIGRNFGTVVKTYATGRVFFGFKPGDYIDGLVGKNDGLVYSSYWDTRTTGLEWSDGGQGYETDELQSETGEGFIYQLWNFMLWDFGTSSQYPALKYRSLDPATQR